jgi:hypothetical protein
LGWEVPATVYVPRSCRPKHLKNTEAARSKGILKSHVQHNTSKRVCTQYVELKGAHVTGPSTKFFLFVHGGHTVRRHLPLLNIPSKACHSLYKSHIAQCNHWLTWVCQRAWLIRQSQNIDSCPSTCNPGRPRGPRQHNSNI